MPQGGRLHRCLKVGCELELEVLVELGNIGPDEVIVELYHGAMDCWEQISRGQAVRLQCFKQDGQQKYWFSGSICYSSSGQRGAAVRIMPFHTDIVNPAEMGLVLWASPSIEPAAATAEIR